MIFLFAYAILRSIPNKLAAAVALVISIAVSFIIPTNKSKFQEIQSYPINQVLF
jgi:quinol-cytochrome oxidoreductase complex cytochrome b subunit